MLPQQEVACKQGGALATKPQARVGSGGGMGGWGQRGSVSFPAGPHQQGYSVASLNLTALSGGKRWYQAPQGA